MLARRFFGLRVRRGLLGLGLVLFAPLIGDARDLLFANLGFLSTTTKYYDPFEFDRALGRLVLFLGWCWIARGLGGDRRPADAGAGRLWRLAFRLRWLPVPVLATTGLYVGFALQKVEAQRLVVDVSNPPPGSTLRLGGQDTVFPRNQNRYAEAIEYLFGVPLPRGAWLPTFEQLHAEFHSDPTRISLQNWQPDWSWLFVTSKDGTNKRGLVVFLDLGPCPDGPDTITVGKPSAVACDNWYQGQGRCLIQKAYYRLDAKEIRVTVDLTGLQPESYEGIFPSRFDAILGGKWPQCAVTSQ